MGFSSESSLPSRLALPWVTRLRYAMAAGQMLTAILVDRLLEIPLPLGWMCIPPAVTALTNVLLEAYIGTPEPSKQETDRARVAIGWAFLVDTLCLTAQLMLTGGQYNPFAVLYLVQVTLSASILTQRQTWGLGAIASACYGILFAFHRPLPALEVHHRGPGAGLHFAGMWVAFLVATFLVALFAGKIAGTLREREASLLRMQEELARKERLAALVTLAAGAAHELNTPLATIAVVAKELERYATRTVPDDIIAEDSRLIRTEVERCRGILSQLSAEGAEPGGEANEPVVVGELLRAAAQASRSPGQVRIAVDEGLDAMVALPGKAVQQALAGLVNNGLDASTNNEEVLLRAEAGGEAMVRFVVEDSGAGMSEQTLRHVGEPFYTTKAPGRGMGLGVFLVRNLADSMGGTFQLSSTVGQGTRATLELPVEAVGEIVTKG